MSQLRKKLVEVRQPTDISRRATERRNHFHGTATLTGRMSLALLKIQNAEIDGSILSGRIVLIKGGQDCI